MADLLAVAEHFRTQVRPEAYRADPTRWVTDKLGEHLWSAQANIARSVVANRYTAVPSCHDAGKSFVAARLAAWWIAVHPEGEAFVVSTAPTSAQVSAILWREIGRAHRKGNLVGRILSAGYPQWKIDVELVGYGRKPNDYEQAAFQGIHARYVLVIMDEAGGIDRSLYNAVDALATNSNARVLAIGNPDDPSSHFATICKYGSGWNVISLDGLRTPNFTAAEIAKYPDLAALFDDEGITPSTEPVPDDLRPMLLSPEWVNERMTRWGVGSELWQAKVRGQFPDTSMAGIIPLGWVQAAVRRWHEWQDRGCPTPTGARVLGVDVADQGDDMTTIATRQGDVVMALEEHSHWEPMQTANRVAEMIRPVPQTRAVVDVVGVGSGVASRLRELGLAVVAFSAGSKTTQRDSMGEFRFYNTRAAAWWQLRELLDPSLKPTIALPDDERLIGDLTTPRWSLRTGNVIVVESKDEIRKRLGRSTDFGDAVVQSTWVSRGPSALTGSDTVAAWSDTLDGTEQAVLAWQ